MEKFTTSHCRRILYIYMPNPSFDGYFVVFGCSAWTVKSTRRARAPCGTPRMYFLSKFYVASVDLVHVFCTEFARCIVFCWGAVLSTPLGILVEDFLQSIVS